MSNEVSKREKLFSCSLSKILIYHQDEKIADFRLPLPLTNIDTTLTEYLQYFPQEMPNYVIYMIQAGHCAMAYVEEGQVIEHKTIKTYMVRKKQGKNQLKHLESKGKSKAGSRIRLTNTVHFFEDINERLQFRKL